MDNKKPARWCLQYVALFLLWGVLTQQSAFGDTAVVRSVLFYSPTCPHCQEVSENVLKPLVNQYREQLLIVAVNVRQADGQALYQNAIKQFAIADDRRGVPTLITGERVMVGGAEIPQEYPALVARLLDEGGIDLPRVPGLEAALGDVERQPEAAHQAPDFKSDLVQKIKRDPLGNGAAILMLIVMLMILAQSLWRFFAQAKTLQEDVAPGWSVALLALIGLAIAAYMGYVETAEVLAVCGPVGDCNTVQQSVYAKLFGIPLGIVGMAGYVVILIVWLVSRRASENLAAMSRLALFAIALGGTLFSIYLTFLEPFVIGATCAWCLGSALCMTLLLVFTRTPAAASWKTLFDTDKP